MDDAHRDEAPVAVEGTGIDPIAATAIRNPRAESLAKPEWKKGVCVAGSQVLALISRRKINERINRHRRLPTLRIIVENAIANAGLDIADTVMRAPAAQAVECKWCHQVKLQPIGRRIIKREVRRPPGSFAATVCVKRPRCD